MSRSNSSFKIGYVTDVEGNLNYFRRYVEMSHILDFDDDGELMLAHDAHFVFGGDLFDKQPGDLRLSSLLVNLKERHPERVHLLVGNRDSNKLRFAAELSDEDIGGRSLESAPALSVLPESIAPKEFLESLTKHVYSDAEVDDVLLSKLNTRTNRLKWMLTCTLGSSDAFEYRRLELSILQDVDSSSISDDQVTQSFLDSVERPDGAVLRYLRCADIAVIIGNTLFVHGAITAESMGFVPDAIELGYFDRDSGGALVSSAEEVPGRMLPEGHTVHEWVEQLNLFAQAALDDFERDPTWHPQTDSKAGLRRGGQALIGFQSRAATCGRNVVVTTFMEKSAQGGKVTPVADEVVQYLNGSGIHRVVVGHKPVGDSPLIIPHSDLEIVMGDTSFSDVSADDNRGIACHEARPTLALTQMVPEPRMLELVS
eukprot:gene3742-4681_t